MKKRTPIEKRPRTPTSRFLLRANIARGFQNNEDYYSGTGPEAIRNRYISFVTVWNGFENRPELYIP